jgi:type II restriction enzyme
MKILSLKLDDDIFNETAVPPEALVALGVENRDKNGIVEAYIYDMFKERYGQMSSALNYSLEATKETFDLETFIDLFWNEPGLKRSIDKIYEIVVYSLFSVIVTELDINIEVSLNPEKLGVLKEFESFAEKVICINADKTSFKSPANINRVGVTNAADRGLDMWANFGPAIQIKHLSLNEKLAEDIVTTVTSDRIVIVCKDTEQSVVDSLLNQLGWKSRIQSIITEKELIDWYKKALSGIYSDRIGAKLLRAISDEIVLEFPSSDNNEFEDFYVSRNYNKLFDEHWR